MTGFLLPASIRNEPTALPTESNVNVAGLYIYRVDGSAIETNCYGRYQNDANDSI